jgi:WD40 repeat protein
MPRRMLVVLGALLALGVWALAPAGAQAGEGCPNEAVREAQESTYLPDCRGYELVSSGSNNQSYISTVDFASNGSRVLWLQPNADATLAVGVREGLAGGAGRWLQSSMVPPAQELLEGNYVPMAVAPDRGSLVFSVEPGLLAGGPNTQVQVDVDGKQRVLGPTIPGKGDAGREDMVLSSDGAHEFFDTSNSLDPTHVAVAGTRDVYDIGVSPPVLVSRLPDGSVPACGVGSFGFANHYLLSTERQGWASADGSKVFFLSSGSGECESSPLELYRRDIAKGETTLISGPAVSGPEGETEFLRASSDGESAVFVTTARLVAQDTNSDPDVYRWTRGAGVECLTCVVPDANPVTAAGANYLSGSIAVSEDLSRIYFVSSKQLAPQAMEGVPNLYVLGGGVIKFVAPGANIRYLVDNSGYGSELTPDGSVLVFGSSSSELNAVTGSNNGGLNQYYRYDDHDDSLTCVSCPPDGVAPTAPVPSTIAGGSVSKLVYAQALSDDGRRFVFRTDAALVPQDVNAGSDLYEWHDGTVGLITNGLSENGTVERANVVLDGISSNGTDVFFRSFEKLTAAATNSGEVYDARAGGGEPPAPSVAGCDGEACQGQTATAPVLGVPASVGFTGAGNVQPAAQKPSKPLTRAQRLKRALRECRSKHGVSRRRCEARARRSFGNGARVGRGK